MGFLVKLADFGLSSVELQTDILAGEEFKQSLLYRNESGYRFCLKRQSFFWDEATRLVSNFQLFTDFGKRFAAGESARNGGFVSDGFDLQVVMNNFSTHPGTYRNSATVAYEELEMLQTYIKHPSRCSLSTSPVQLYHELRIDSRQGFFSKPTLHLPVGPTDAVTTPLKFLSAAEFLQYRVWSSDPIPSYEEVLKLREASKQLELCCLVLDFHQQWWAHPAYCLPGAVIDATDSSNAMLQKQRGEDVEIINRSLRARNSALAQQELGNVNDTLLACGLGQAPLFSFYPAYDEDVRLAKERSDALYQDYYNAVLETVTI